MHRNRQVLVAIAAVFCALFVASGAVAASSLSPAEAGLLQAVNATRAANGLQPLSLDPTLTRAARRHTTEMIRDGYFAHGNFAGRMLAFHVHGPFLGENLAWGSGAYASAGAVISEWLHSPGHRANLLRPSFTRIGIGAVQGSFLGNGGSTVVTADFAGN
jgi:Uncharacterized protein with SCP/PR1 domains